MHSTVENLQAELAMQPTKANIRKILLATNIAESSITVPDVKYGKLRNKFPIPASCTNIKFCNYSYRFLFDKNARNQYKNEFSIIATEMGHSCEL